MGYNFLQTGFFFYCFGLWGFSLFAILRILFCFFTGPHFSSAGESVDLGLKFCNGRSDSKSLFGVVNCDMDQHVS